MAGRGSRLSAKTDSLPKPLIPINRKSLFERNLENLRSAGFVQTPIALVGYLSEAFPTEYGCDYRVNEAWESTSQVQTLELAATELSRNRCLVLYGDVFHNVENLKNYLSTDADLSAVGNFRDWEANWRKRYDNPLEDLETFAWDHQSGMVRGLGRQPQNLDEIDGQFSGAVVFTPNLWNFFERTAIPQKATSMTACLDDWVSAGNPLVSVSATSPWFEIDTLRDLQYAENNLP